MISAARFANDSASRRWAPRDGVLIYFGYPGAHEDDAERAHVKAEGFQGVHFSQIPKGSCERRHHQHAGQWQGDTQRAARGFVRLRQFELGRFDFGKDAPASSSPVLISAAPSAG